MENTAFYMGQEVKVLTYGANVWNSAKYSGKRNKTTTSNEVYYFDGSLGRYGVVAEDLPKRVKTKEMFEIWFVDAEGKKSYERTLAYFPDEAEKNIKNFYGEGIKITKIK